MSLKTRVILIMIIIGAVLGIAGFSDTMLILKGNKVDLSAASVSDFDKAAMCEGTINFAEGPFAEYEVTETKYGVVKSKRVTNYYLVGNVNSKKNGYDYLAVLAVPEDNASAIDKLVEKWEDYWYDETGDVDMPTATVTIKGKLIKQPTDSKYVKFLDNFLGDEFDKSELGEMCIRQGEVSKISLVLFFGGVAVALAGIIIFVAGFVKARKSKNEELY